MRLSLVSVAGTHRAFRAPHHTPQTSPASQAPTPAEYLALSNWVNVTWVRLFGRKRLGNRTDRASRAPAAGTSSDAPTSPAQHAPHRSPHLTTSVRGGLSSGPGEVCAVFRILVLIWGSCCGWRWYAGRGLACGHGGCRPGGMPCQGGRGARCPGVFSPYVVQAGSAACAGGAGSPAPTAFNRAGEKAPGDRGGLPGVVNGVVPDVDAGSPSPFPGREVCGHPQRVRLDGAGQAASAVPGWPRPASAGFQLVPCTVME